MQLLPDLRQVIFRDTEEQVDRLQLRDHEHAVRIGRMNDVARIDETQTNASGNRRRDAGIADVDFRSVDLSLIDLHDAFVLMDRGDLRVELLFRNRVFTVGQLITIEIDVRVFEQRLVTQWLSLCLFELRLKRTRIDLREQVALLDHLTLAVVDADQLTVDATLDRDGVHRRNRTERVDVNADTSLLRGGGGDRDTGLRRRRFIRGRCGYFLSALENEKTGEGHE